jgi:hypothetical protein
MLGQQFEVMAASLGLELGDMKNVYRILYRAGRIEKRARGVNARPLDLDEVKILVKEILFRRILPRSQSSFEDFERDPFCSYSETFDDAGKLIGLMAVRSSVIVSRAWIDAKAMRALVSCAS